MKPMRPFALGLVLLAAAISTAFASDRLVLFEYFNNVD
jgi:hypothetical protein